MTTNTTLALHNGKTEQTLQAGQAHKFKAKAGERYRIVKRQGSDEKLLDNVIAKRSGDDLQLRYQDDTQVTLENYYVECKALAACDITLPGPDGGLYRPGAESAAGAALADGSHLVYAHGAPDTLMAMAQGQPAMLSALAGLQGAQISYIPSDSSTLAGYGWVGAALLLGMAGGGGQAAPVVLAPVTPPKDSVAPLLPTSPWVASDDVAPITGAIADKASTNDARPTFSGSGAEAGATVTLVEGNTVLGSELVAADGSWQITVAADMADGVHRVSYNLTDAAGNRSATSAAIEFSVDTHAPAAPVVIAAIDDVGTITGSVASGGVSNDAKLLITGKAEANVAVLVYDGVVLLGTVTADANGDWSCTTPALADGAHAFSAQATDAAGNVGIASANHLLTVDTVAPNALTVALDPIDDGNATNGVDLRVTLAPDAKAGDTVATLILRDGVAVQTINKTLISKDIVAGQIGVHVDAADVTVDGRYSVTAQLTDPAGNQGLPVSNAAAFTVFTGLVHDDYMANAFVFVDSNRNNRWDADEATTRTDAKGHFKFAFDPQGAPVLAMGGVDTASGAANSGVVYKAYTGSIDASAAGVDIVLSPLSSLIAAVADQAAAKGQTIDSAALLAAAQVVNKVLSLGSSDPASLLNFDPVAASAAAGASVGDRGLLSANRQLGLLFSATASIVDGAAGDAPTGTGSAMGIGALAGLVRARSQSQAVVSLSSTADIEATVQRTMDASNASGFTQDLRTSTAADLTLLSSVIGGFNARVDATTQAGAQSADAVATLRAASDQLLPMLSKSGSEAAGDRGGDMSLSASLAALSSGVAGQADVAAYVKTQAEAVSQVSAVFETNDAVGKVGRLVHLDIQLPSLGLGNAIDNLTLSGLPAGVELLRIDPLTGVATVLQPAGGAYAVAPQDAGYLAIRSASVVSGSLTLAATNLVGKTSTSYSGTLAIAIGALPAINQVTLDAAVDDVGSVQGALAKGALTDDARPTLTGSLSLALTPGDSVAVYDGAVFLGNATVSGRAWSFTPGTPLANGTHGLSARVLSGALVQSASSPFSLSVDSLVLAPVIDVVATDDLVNAAEQRSVVTGSAKPGATVALTLGAGNVRSVVADAQGVWRYTLAAADIAAMGQGSETISATATDAVSNTSSAGTRAISVDTLAPAAPSITAVIDDVLPVTGAVAPGGASNDPSLEIRGTAEAGAKVSVYNGAELLGTAQADASGAWRFNTPALAQGKTYAFNAKASDAAGNTGPASAEHLVTVDVGVPAAGTLAFVNFTDTGVAGDFITQDKSFDLSLSGQQPGASVAYQVSTDGGATWGSTSAAQSGLADGAYQFRALVTGATGTTATTAPVAVKVDNSLPAAGTLAFVNFTDTGVAGDLITQDKDFDLSLSGQQPGASVAYQVSTDGGATWGSTSAAQSGLADGAYQFRAVVTGATGTTATTAPVAVKVDNSLPAAGTLAFVNFTDTGVAGDFITQDKDFDLSLSGQQPGASVAYQISTDGGVTWGSTSAAQSGLADGAYQFRAVVTGVNGTTATTAPIAVKVDNSTPAAGTLAFVNFTDTGLAGDFITQDKDFEMSLTGHQLGASVAYQVTTDGGATWASTSAAQSGLADGAYQFRAVVTGVTGTTANTAPVAVKVDNSAPAAGTLALTNFTDTGVVGDSITQDKDFEMSLTGHQPGASVAYQVSTDGGATWGSTTAAQSGLADGAYQFRALVTGVAGGSATTALVAVKVDNSAPAAGTLALANFTDTGVAGDLITQDKSFDLSLSGQQPGASVAYQVSTDGGVTWGSTSVAQSGLADGAYQFRAVVTGVTGATATTAPVAVKVDNSLPAAGTLAFVNFTDTGVAGDFITQDKDFDLSLSGQQPGASVAYQVTTDGGATWASTSAAQSGLADGAYQFRAVVTGTGGTTANTAPVALRVDNTAPSVAASSASYAENQPANAQVATVSASDAVGVTAFRFADSGSATSSDGYFNISASGRVSLSAAGAAAGVATNDFEIAPNRFSHAIQAADAAGNWSTAASLDLNLSDVNEVVPDTTPPAAEVDTTAPNALSVSLDPADDGDSSNGVDLRVTLKPDAMAGDTVATLVMRDGVQVQAIASTLTQAHINAGHVVVRVAAESVANDGSYSVSAQLSDPAGNQGNTVTNTAAFTVFTGLVHDDYLANAFVFVDSNRNNKWDMGEPTTDTDASGHFKFAFDPNGAPVLAMGGVDTASGSSNSGVVYKAYTGSINASAAGVDIVLSPLSSLIAAVADQAAAVGQKVDSTMLLAAAQVVNTVLELGSSDAGNLLAFDPVAASKADNASVGDRGLLSANRQLGLLFSATASIVDGAGATDAPTGTGSAMGIGALAGLVRARSQTETSVSLSNTADIEATVQRTMDAANASGFTQDLRASSAADLTLLSSVIGGYNARVDITTQAGAQSADAVATMRAASDQLLPMLSKSGSEAAGGRGGDISLSASLATLNTGVAGTDIGDYVKAQTDAVSQVSAVFETSAAVGKVGRLIRLDIQLPSLGLGDMIDNLSLSGLTAGVELLRVDPLTGVATAVPLVGGAYAVFPQDVGYLAIKSASVFAGSLNLAATNLVGSTTTAYSGTLAIEIGALPVISQVTLLAVTDDVRAVTGPLAKGALTDDARPTLTGSLSAALQTDEVVAVYDGATNLGNATVSGLAWSYTPVTPLADGAHGLSARVLSSVASGSSVQSSSSLFNLSVDAHEPAAPPLFPSDGHKVAGTAEPGATVRVSRGGTVVGTAVADARGAWSFNLSSRLSDGALSATATDAAGWTSDASDGVVLLGAPTQVPTLLSVNDDVERFVGALLLGASSNDVMPTLRGGLSAALTEGLSLHVVDAGVDIGAAQVDGTSWSFTPAALAPGAHSFKVQVFNGTVLGAESSTFAINVDTLAPATPVIGVVASDDLINATEQRSAVTGSAERGATVALTLGTGNVRSVVANGQDVNGQAAWRYTLAAADIAAMGQGSETLRATATDAAGNVSPATATDADGKVSPVGTRTISVDTLAPAAGTLSFSELTDSGSSTSDGITQDGTFDLSVAGSEVDATLSYEVSTDNGTTWTPTTAIQTSLADRAYRFRSTATDAAGNRATGSAVSLTLDNTAPSITSGTSVAAITESSGAAHLVYTATATGITTGAAAYSLKADTGDGSSFTINASTGAVTLTGNPDYETKPSYSFTVVATDTAGNASEKVVTLAITNLYEAAPSITSSATATAIAENSSAGQLVYTATSQGTADTATGATAYSLKAGAGDGSAFTINASTGAVTLTGSPDFDTKPSYSFTLVATDTAGNASEKVVTLAITNIDEAAPRINSSATATAIDENSRAGQVVYTATSTDADIVTGSTEYSLKPATGDADAFSINASTGEVALTDSPDFESKPSYSFTVVATDAAGHADEKIVTLDIHDMEPEGPSITSRKTAVAINENIAANSEVYTATSTGFIDTPVYSLKASNDADLTIDAATGAVRLTGIPDFETKPSYSFTVVATGTDSVAVEKAVTLAINNLNDNAPVFTSGASGAVDENTAISTAVYTAATTDADNLAARTYTVSGADAAKVDISAAGVVTLKASADYESATQSYAFDVIASDGLNTSTQAVVVSVNNLNDNAPVFTSGATGAVDENAAISTVVYTAVTTDVDNLAERSYTVSGADAAKVDISAAGVVTLKASADYESNTKSYGFDVIANDGLHTTPQAVVVSVNNRDDTAPSFTSLATATAILHNTGAGQVVYTAASNDTLVDYVSGSTTYSLAETGDGSLFSIDSGTGAVTLTDNPIYRANPYAFTVVATDAAGNAREKAVNLSVTGPVVNQVAITSADSILNNTLNRGDPVVDTGGDTLRVTVTMNEAVIVTGTPSLTLNIGGVNAVANYASGSDTDKLVFTYTIPAFQTNGVPNPTATDTNGISIDANKISLNGGTIRAVGVDALLSHDAVLDNPGFMVDTTPPVLTGITSNAPVTVIESFGQPNKLSYRVGAGQTATVSFTFSEPVFGFTSDGFVWGGAGRAVADWGTLSNPTVSPTDSKVYNMTFEPILASYSGTVTFHSKSSSGGISYTFADAAGNANGADSVKGYDLAVDTVPLTGSIFASTNGSNSSLFIKDTPRTLRIGFNKNMIQNLTDADFEVVDAVVTNVRFDPAKDNMGRDGYNWLFDYDPIGSGSHSIKLKAGGYNDSYGNIGTEAFLTVEVDNVSPTVTITSDDDSPLLQNHSRLITFTFSEPLQVEPQVVSFQGLLTRAELVDVSGGLVYTALFTPYTGFSGDAVIKVNYYVDRADNFGDPAELTVKVDTQAPLVITSNRSELHAEETATITFTFNDDPGGSFDRSDISVIGGTLSAISGDGLIRTAIFTPTAGLAAGYASITVAGTNVYPNYGNLILGETTPKLIVGHIADDQIVLAGFTPVAAKVLVGQLDSDGISINIGYTNADNNFVPYTDPDGKRLVASAPDENGNFTVRYTDAASNIFDYIDAAGHSIVGHVDLASGNTISIGYVGNDDFVDNYTTPAINALIGSIDTEGQIIIGLGHTDESGYQISYTDPDGKTLVAFAKNDAGHFIVGYDNGTGNTVPYPISTLESKIIVGHIADDQIVLAGFTPVAAKVLVGKLDTEGISIGYTNAAGILTPYTDPDGKTLVASGLDENGNFTVRYTGADGDYIDAAGHSIVGHVETENNNAVSIGYFFENVWVGGYTTPAINALIGSIDTGGQIIIGLGHTDESGYQISYTDPDGKTLIASAIDAIGGFSVNYTEASGETVPYNNADGVPIKGYQDLMGYKNAAGKSVPYIDDFGNAVFCIINDSGNAVIVRKDAGGIVFPGYTDVFPGYTDATGRELAAYRESNGNIVVGYTPGWDWQPLAAYSVQDGNVGTYAGTPLIAIHTLELTLSISVDAQDLPLITSALVTFTFSSDPGTSFVNADVTLTGGTLSEISGDGLIRTAVFTPIPGFIGIGGIEVAAGEYSADGALGGRGLSPDISIGRPPLVITSNTAVLSQGNEATITFTFSKDPGDSFGNNDVSVIGGTLSAISGDGLIRTAIFTSAAGGPARISVVGTSTGPDGTTIVIGDNDSNGLVATLESIPEFNNTFIYLVDDTIDANTKVGINEFGIKYLTITQGSDAPYIDPVNGKTMAGYIDDQGNPVLGYTVDSSTGVGYIFEINNPSPGPYASLTLNTNSTVGFINSIGAFGIDVLIGSVGDDTLAITPELLQSLNNSEYQKVDGGIGIDTLALTGKNMPLDLTALRSQTFGGFQFALNLKLQSIERIDLTGSGNNQLNLVLQDVLNIAGVNSFNSANGWGNTDASQRHQLVVDGDAGDVVNSSGWGAAVGSVVHSGVTYDIYNQGLAQLLVAHAVIIGP